MFFSTIEKLISWNTEANLIVINFSSGANLLYSLNNSISFSSSKICLDSEVLFNRFSNFSILLFKFSFLIFSSFRLFSNSLTYFSSSFIFVS